MRALLPLLLADLALFAFVGVALLAWAPAGWARVLLPAAPAIGGAGLAVILQVTGLVVGARIATLIVLPVLALLLAVRSRRTPWWRALSGAPVRWLMAALVAGIIPAWFVFQPIRLAGAAVVQPSLNNDAFYFVTVTDWLLSHPAIQRPVDRVDAPAYGNVRLTMQQGLRLGEEYDEAALATVTNQDPEATWSTTIVMWLLYLPGAVVATFGALGVSRRAGLLAGVVAGSSAIVAAQVLNQNSAGLLGIVLAPLAVALFCRYVEGRRPPPTSVAAADHASPPPLWLVVLLVDGLVGAYTEYLPLLAVGLAAFVLIRRLGDLPQVILATARVLGCALLAGPLIWWDAIRSLTITTGLTNGSQVSPFLDVSVPTWLARFTGTTPLNLDTGHIVGILLGLWILAGLVTALRLSPARRVLGCLVLGLLAGIVTLGSHLHYYPYGQFRAIEEGVALLLMVAVAGWWELGSQALRRTRRPVAGVAMVAAGAGAALLIAADTGTTATLAGLDWRPRIVDASLVQAEDWVHRYGGPGGGDVTVLVPDFFTQLWTVYGARHDSAISLPVVYPDYLFVHPLHFNDGRLRRYVLVGDGAMVDADPSTLVAQNSRYRLFDTSRGDLVVALGAENLLSPYFAVAASQVWFGPTGRMLIAHTAGVRRAVISIMPRGGAAAAVETLTVEHGGVQTVALASSATTAVTVTLSDTTLSVVDFDDGRPPPAVDFNRNGYDDPMALVVAGVRRG